MAFNAGGDSLSYSGSFTSELGELERIQTALGQSLEKLNGLYDKMTSDGIVDKNTPTLAAKVAENFKTINETATAAFKACDTLLSSTHNVLESNYTIS